MTYTDPNHERVESTVLAAPAPPNSTAPATTVEVRQRRSGYTSRFEPDAIVAAAAGLLLILTGLIGVTRAGLAGPMAEPVVKVAGYTHTATLALIEVALGICLVLAAMTRSRNGELFFGGLLGIGAFVGAVETESFTKTLALEFSMARLAVIVGVIVVLAALLLPRYTHRSTTVEANQSPRRA